MIAGSKGMSGAAYLSAKAAYAVGAGLVQIYTHEVKPCDITTAFYRKRLLQHMTRLILSN